MLTIRSPRLPEMGERRLAQRERADDVQLQDGAKVVEAELVDGAVRRVPAGVVDQAVDSAVPRKRLLEERLTVVLPRHVTADEGRRARPVGRDTLGNSAPEVRLEPAEDDVRARLGEDMDTAFADALGASGDDRHLVAIAHEDGPSPPDRDYRAVALVPAGGSAGRSTTPESTVVPPRAMTWKCSWSRSISISMKLRS